MKNEYPKSIKLRVEASFALEDREARQIFAGFVPLWIIFLA
jgi:hypothetical protein